MSTKTKRRLSNSEGISGTLAPTLVRKCVIRRFVVISLLKTNDLFAVYKSSEY